MLAGFVLLPQLGSRAEPDRDRGAGDGCRASCWRSPCGRRNPRDGDRDRRRRAGAVPGRRARSPSIRSTSPSSASIDRETLVWREEGAQTTVAVHDRGGNPPMRVMYLDGNHQANDSPATRVHPPSHRRAAGDAASQRRARRWSSASAAAPRPAPSRATTSTSTSSSCRRPSSAAPSYFKHINFDLLARPNVRLHVDDGRNFLLMSRKKYDVITADIILPRHAGAGSLYSREYLRAGAQRRWPTAAW